MVSSEKERKESNESSEIIKSNKFSYNNEENISEILEEPDETEDNDFYPSSDKLLTPDGRPLPLSARWLPTPYSAKETLLWFWRNVAGACTENPGNLKFFTPPLELNSIEANLTIGFVGDIMDLSGRKLEVTNEVKNYFQDVDLLVGNFEATIIEGLKINPFDQRHREDILEKLGNIVPPNKWILSVANNHAGDFSKEQFDRSISMLKNAGFKVFGEFNKPYIDINENVRLITGTKWSNKRRGFDFAAHFESVYDSIISNKMNIFYPHWGYELECFPRLEMIDEGLGLLDDVDAIIGHHTHIPQPITREPQDLNIESLDTINPLDKVIIDGERIDMRELEKYKAKTSKLIAYSLGDFCFGKKISLYQFGQILKITIGPSKDEPNRWKIGNADWKYVRSHIKGSNVYIELIENHEKFLKLLLGKKFRPEFILK